MDGPRSIKTRRLEIPDSLRSWRGGEDIGEEGGRGVLMLVESKNLEK